MQMPIVPIIPTDVLDEWVAQGVVEHLGLAALDKEKVTHAEVFEIGFRAGLIALYKHQNAPPARKRSAKNKRVTPDQSKGETYVRMFHLIHDYADKFGKDAARKKMKEAAGVNAIRLIKYDQYANCILAFSAAQEGT